MGLLNEFVDVHRNDGPIEAVKWIGRNGLLSHYHSASHSFVETCSPLILDQRSLEQKFKENDSIECYDQKREVTIELPAGDNHVERFTERTGTYTISQPFVGELRDATLIGSYPIALDNNHRIVREATVSPEVLTLNLGYSLKDFLQNPQPNGSDNAFESVDSAVLLYNRWNRGYYHWTVETLTRLEGVKTYEERTGESPKLIVGPDLTRFQAQSLELLGYSSEDLIPWDRRMAHIDRLIVPSMRRELNRGTVSPIAYQWLRDQMRSAASDMAPGASGNFTKRVYISRNDAPRRRVVNEPEVLDVLREYGFEKYVLSEHSVAENVELFAQADTIVAPHGAGLTDLIYADDATVVELFRSNDVRPTYYVLSEHLDHRYRYLLCDYEGPNLIVDTDALEDIIRSETRDSKEPVAKLV